MFATLLDPAAFAATLEGRIALVRELGGPFFTGELEEAHAARTAGLQIGLLFDADAVTEHVAAAVRALDPEIVALRCAALGDASARDDAQRSELLANLAASLALLDGRHRMIVAVDGALPPLSAAEWGALPAESLVIDPIRDPDAWRAAATWPGARGLLLGLVPPPGEGEPEGPEVLLWALGYAASLGGRGGDRIGVAGLSRRSSAVPVIDSADAAHRIAALVQLLALANADAATRRAHLDPRAISPGARALSERQRG